jgi:thiol-disulfide isomerase/thioredoxin
LAQINNHITLRDSLAKAVFKNQNAMDGSQAFFYEKVRLDNLFLKFGSILSLNKSLGLSYEQVKDLLKHNIDAAVLNHISNDAYLISDQYKELISGDYLTFLVEMDYLKDSSLKHRKNYRVEKIKSTYTAEVKEYATKEAIKSRFFWSKSVEELKEYKHLFQTYIDDLSNRQYKDILKEFYAIKLNELIKTQVGKPAPLFTLKSAEGKTYSNEDFKGKIIFIDFWASWCLPCREETPHLQELYNKYLGDNRVVFISIAVHDREKDWRKAMEQDKPSWLQLFDEKDEVQKQYAANAIPKFVLIDKKGCIVRFDAPPPSEKEKLLALLEQEISK